MREVRFSYPARRGQPASEALRGIDASIPTCQSVAILGPNGSGKSTLMKLICGLLPLQAGSIEVLGLHSPQAAREALGVVFQSPGLDRHMTVRENLRDQAVLYAVERHAASQRIDAALARLGLESRHDQLVRTLSGGLIRQVDLVRALIHEPRLLLLDEPTAGLDPIARDRFLDQMQAQREERGLTILMSTHLVDEAERCERVLLMHRGQIVADASPAELRRQAGAARITVLDRQWQPPAGESSNWRQRAGLWRLAPSSEPEVAQVAASRLAQAGIAYSMTQPTLTDFFEELTGDTFDQREGSEEATR